jgi:hypothetical protein
MTLHVVANQRALNALNSVSKHSASRLYDVLYIGHASLVPLRLHALCSCADLFFARILTSDQEHAHVEIAALPHYFDADEISRQRHVRTLTLTHAQFGLLMLEYDRRLASMATCDVLEIVEQHAVQARASQMLQTGKVSVATDILYAAREAVEPEEQYVREHEDVDACEQDHEDADLVPLPTLFIAHGAMRAAFEKLHITMRRERRVHTAILHAALDTLSMRLDRCRSRQEYSRLEQQHDQIRSVQQWRRQRRDRGSGWQRVVVLEPACEQGRAGWNVIIGVPLHMAA